MRIGIDASNIRAGGSLAHLTEPLKAAQPHTYGIERVVVWGGKRILVHLAFLEIDDPALRDIADKPVKVR